MSLDIKKTIKMIWTLCCVINIAKTMVFAWSE